MINTIRLDTGTPAEELMTVLEKVLTLLVARIGVSSTVATLFGTAVLMTIDNESAHDR